MNNSPQSNRCVKINRLVKQCRKKDNSGFAFVSCHIIDNLAFCHQGERRMKSFVFRACQSPLFLLYISLSPMTFRPHLSVAAWTCRGPTHIDSYTYDKFSGGLDTAALGQERPRRSWRSCSPALWVLLVCTASARRCFIREPGRWAGAGGGYAALQIQVIHSLQKLYLLTGCRGSGRITALSGKLLGKAKNARGNRSLCHPRYRGSGHARSFDLRM
jgi:hypothetical protein